MAQKIRAVVAVISVSTVLALLGTMLTSAMLVERVDAATTTLEPIQDAFVGMGGSGYGDPDANHGDETELSVGVESLIWTRSFIKFDIPEFSPTTTIDSAELSVFVTQISGSENRLVAVSHPASSWSESSITWNNMPSTGDSITSGQISGIGRHSFDITQAVSDWVSGSRTNRGVVLQSGSKIVWMGSSEGPVNWRPRLTINYTESLPDLEVFTGLNASPMSVNAGSDTVLDITIRNAGSQTITSPIYIKAYLSADSTITTGDSYLGQLIRYDDLSAGQGLAISNWHVEIPQNTFDTGDYYIGIILDPSNNIEESDESNNTKYADPFHVESRPDLIVASVSAQPAEVTAGTDELEVTYNIQNIGYGSAGVVNQRNGTLFEPNTLA